MKSDFLKTVDRRQFLIGLGALAGAFGCGSDSNSSLPFSGGAGGPTSPVGARVDLSQIGGNSLSILAGLRSPANVAQDGSVTVTTSDTLAQVLFVMDGNRALRGLALKLPGQGLAVDAASTALALVFLVPGIATGDAALAAERVRLLQQAPSFSLLVQRLRDLLPTNTITAILPQLQPLVEAVTREAAGVSPKVEPFTPVQAKSDRPGGIFLEPGSELNNANGSFKINNLSGRYVSVVRQVITVRNQSAGAFRTNLIGTPLAGAVSSVGPINLYSIGNFLTGQTLTASSARDDFPLTQHNPPLDRAVYFVRGLGTLTHPDNAELPADVTSDLFDNRTDLATVVLSVLMPILEPVLATVKFAALAPEDILNAVGGGVTVAGLSGLQASANSGDRDNLKSALLDTFVTFVTNPVVVEGLAALVGGGTVTAELLVETVITPFLLCLSAANFLITAIDIVQRPRYVAIEAPLPVGRFLDVISDDPVSVLDVNAQGEVLYQNNGSTFRKKPFAAAQSLGSDVAAGAISDDGPLITFSRSSDGSVVLRSDAASGNVPFPSGFRSSPLGTNPKIDARGFAVAGNIQNTAGTINDVFLYERLTDTSVALNFRSIPGAPSNVQVGGLSDGAVFAYGRLAGSTLLGRYSRTLGRWFSQSLPKPNASSFANYVATNEKEQAILYEYQEFDDGFNPVRSVESVLLEGSDGAITRVFEGGITPGEASSRPTPIGINDDGQVLVVKNFLNIPNPSTDTFVYTTAGGVTEQSLSSLTPNDAPGGPYFGLGIGGKYVAASRLVQGIPGVTYLFFLGRSVDEVKTIFGA